MPETPVTLCQGYVVIDHGLIECVLQEPTLCLGGSALNSETKQNKNPNVTTLNRTFPTQLRNSSLDRTSPSTTGIGVQGSSLRL